MRSALKDYGKTAGAVLVGALVGVIFGLIAALVIGPIALVLIRSLTHDHRSKWTIIDYLVDLEGSVFVATGVGVMLFLLFSDWSRRPDSEEAALVGKMGGAWAFCVTLAVVLWTPDRGSQLLVHPWWWPLYVLAIAVPLHLWMATRPDARRSGPPAAQG